MSVVKTLSAATDQFGDFQTPTCLAREVCELLTARGIAPVTVVEPTCGLGSFVKASLHAFPEADCVATDINPVYVAQLAREVAESGSADRADIARSDFFERDWGATLAKLRGPVLVLGNPPWVTSAGVGTAGGTNLPTKSNFQQHVGLGAVTGKSKLRHLGVDADSPPGSYARQAGLASHTL